MAKTNEEKRQGINLLGGMLSAAHGMLSSLEYAFLRLKWALTGAKSLMPKRRR